MDMLAAAAASVPAGIPVLPLQNDTSVPMLNLTYTAPGESVYAARNPTLLRIIWVREGSTAPQTTPNNNNTTVTAHTHDDAACDIIIIIAGLSCPLHHWLLLHHPLLRHLPDVTQIQSQNLSLSLACRPHLCRQLDLEHLYSHPACQPESIMHGPGLSCCVGCRVCVCRAAAPF